MVDLLNESFFENFDIFDTLRYIVSFCFCSNVFTMVFSFVFKVFKLKKNFFDKIYRFLVAEYSMRISIHNLTYYSLVF